MRTWKQNLIDYVVRNKNTISLGSPKDTLKFLLKEAIQDNPNISASLKKKRGIPDKMESRSLTKSVLTNVLMGGRRKKTIKITKKINNKRNNKKSTKK